MNLSISDFLKEDCERVYRKASLNFKELYNSTVVITGGTGFLGLWTAEMISYLNDNFNKAIELHIVARDFDKFKKIAPHLFEKKYINFIRSDIRSLNELPKDTNFIIHAASNPDNRIYSSTPFAAITAISDGTSSVLKATERLANLKMFLNFSSGNVYGKQPDELNKIPESFIGTFSSNELNSVYAEAKRFTEALLTAARNELRLPVVNIRPFSFLGPFQSLDAPWAANNFINDALNERPIKILGDGKTIRTIMYGADAAIWILTFLTKSQSGSVYNMGSDDGKNVYEIAKIVSSCFKPEPDVLLNCSLAGNIPNSKLIPDIEKAKKDFKLDIYTDVKSSVERAVIWFSKIISKVK